MIIWFLEGWSLSEITIFYLQENELVSNEGCIVKNVIQFLIIHFLI